MMRVFISGRCVSFIAAESSRVTLYGGAGDVLERLSEKEKAALESALGHESFRLGRPLTPEEITNSLYRISLYR